MQSAIQLKQREAKTKKEEIEKGREIKIFTDRENDIEKKRAIRKRNRGT